MEVLGAVASSFTLAALFKYSFEALDLIQLYQTQDVDFNRLQLQYKLEKCRLYNWGVQMGLADDSTKNLLSDWHSSDLVSETLQQIVDLFSDAHIIRKKYGCDAVASSSVPSLPAPESSHGIASAFNHFKIQSLGSNRHISRLQKTKWIIRDRNKFLVLVSDVRGLIDSIEKITGDLLSTARLEAVLRIRINEITNADTLFDIASAWKESHPRVASAASTKADSISMMTSGKCEFISEWQTSIDGETYENGIIADIENSTVTELKHHVLSSSSEIEKLKLSLVATSRSVASLKKQLHDRTDGSGYKETKSEVPEVPEVSEVPKVADRKTVYICATSVATVRLPQINLAIALTIPLVYLIISEAIASVCPLICYTLFQILTVYFLYLYVCIMMRWQMDKGASVQALDVNKMAAEFVIFVLSAFVISGSTEPWMSSGNVIICVLVGTVRFFLW